MTKIEKNLSGSYTLSLIMQSLATKSALVTTATTVITKIVGISQSPVKWLDGDAHCGEEKRMLKFILGMIVGASIGFMLACLVRANDD